MPKLTVQDLKEILDEPSLDSFIRKIAEKHEKKKDDSIIDELRIAANSSLEAAKDEKRERGQIQRKMQRAIELKETEVLGDEVEDKEAYDDLLELLNEKKKVLEERQIEKAEANVSILRDDLAEIERQNKLVNEAKERSEFSKTVAKGLEKTKPKNWEKLMAQEAEKQINAAQDITRYKTKIENITNKYLNDYIALTFKVPPLSEEGREKEIKAIKQKIAAQDNIEDCTKILRKVRDEKLKKEVQKAKDRMSRIDEKIQDLLTGMKEKELMTDISIKLLTFLKNSDKHDLESGKLALSKLALNKGDKISGILLPLILEKEKELKKDAAKNAAAKSPSIVHHQKRKDEARVIIPRVILSPDSTTVGPLEELKKRGQEYAKPGQLRQKFEIEIDEKGWHPLRKFAHKYKTRPFREEQYKFLQTIYKSLYSEDSSNYKLSDTDKINIIYNALKHVKERMATTRFKSRLETSIDNEMQAIEKSVDPDRLKRDYTNFDDYLSKNKDLFEKGSNKVLLSTLEDARLNFYRQEVKNLKEGHHDVDLTKATKAGPKKKA